jgi:hypothetical protein
MARSASDEAIQVSAELFGSGLLRCARNDAV